MSITERMENDGLSFGDAAAKESLAAGSPPLTLVQALRVEAADGLAASKTCPNEQVRPAFAAVGRLLTRAADHIEAQDKRFAEHLEAWKANNAHHAARIEELEAAIRTANEDLKSGEGVDLLYYLGAYVREDQKEQRAKVRATLEALLK
jgi:hypothetical protein